MKLLKKYWMHIVCFILIIFLSIFVFTTAFKQVNKFSVSLKEQKNLEIISIWHIETFEGGGKARIEYLKNVARDIEKENSNILFLIKQIEPNNLENELNSATPQIISFGYGVGNIVLPLLKHFNSTFDIRDELIESGSFNQKFYAAPYIVSGYSFFTHSIESYLFHCGQTNYTKPENIYTNLNLTLNVKETQYEAYKSFVYNKKVKLLGTARDLFKVNNLNNIGRTNAIISPVSSYTDLIQYIGICENNFMIKMFVEKVLSTKYQQTLSDYSLFSSLYNKLYHNGIYNEMEEAIYQAEIPNAFEV